MPLGNKDFSARVRSSYAQLTSSAQSLNSATEELTKVGSSFDAALKKLNLGIQTWVNVSSGSDEMGTRSYYDQLGYAKVSGKWGIAIRQVECDERTQDEEITQEWLFADAPRDLRVMAIVHLPELLENLHKQAQWTSEHINSTLENARGVLSILSEVSNMEAKK